MGVYSTASPVYGRGLAKALAGAFSARPAAALVSAFNVRLIKDQGVTLTPDTTVAQLAAHEAAYSGYTAVVATPGSVVNSGPNTVDLEVPATFITGTASPQVSNSIYGYWIDDGTNLMMGEIFPAGTQFSMANPGDFFTLVGLMPIQCMQRP